MLDQKLLDILACPKCKNDVKLIEYNSHQHGLICKECNKIFPIRDGIPVMLIDEAITPE